MKKNTARRKKNNADFVERKDNEEKLKAINQQISALNAEKKEIGEAKKPKSRKRAATASVAIASATWPASPAGFVLDCAVPADLGLTSGSGFSYFNDQPVEYFPADASTSSTSFFPMTPTFDPNGFPDFHFDE